MNILFITLDDFNNIAVHGIYTDLLREFTKHDHKVYIISPTERRNGVNTHIIEEKDCKILKVRIGNNKQTNIIEKGISTVLLEGQLVKATKKYFSNIKFDLVLYSTPPITVAKVVHYIKKRDRAISYLLLKDIFPQNAVDLEMFSKKSLIYKFFRKKEKYLYKISDYIGCMSQANVDYLLNHNPWLNKDHIEVCPNSIEIQNFNISCEEKQQYRKKYGIPFEKIVFVYGGNLGKPQGIDFMIDCLKSQLYNDDVYFLIVGDGIEYNKIKNYIKVEKPKNIKLMSKLPRNEYDLMIASCDVGMIFLDYRFTIPNFPSRLLSYMQAFLPVFTVTDSNADIGKIVVDGDFGWWCISNDVYTFANNIYVASKDDLKEKGNNANNYLINNYLVEKSYKIIIGRLNENCSK